MYVHTLLIRVLRTLLRITSDHHQTHELLHGLLYRYVDCMRSHGGMLSRLLSILTPRGCLLQVLQCYSATATSVMSLRDIDAVMPLLSSVRSIQIVHTERSSSCSFPSLPSSSPPLQSLPHSDSRRFHARHAHAHPAPAARWPQSPYRRAASTASTPSRW